MPPDLSGDTIPASTSSNVLSSFQFIVVSIALVTLSRDFVTGLKAYVTTAPTLGQRAPNDAVGNAELFTCNLCNLAMLKTVPTTTHPPARTSAPLVT